MWRALLRTYGLGVWSKHAWVNRAVVYLSFPSQLFERAICVVGMGRVKTMTRVTR